MADRAAGHLGQPRRRSGLARILDRLGILRGGTGSVGGMSYRYFARQIEIDLPVTGGGRTILVSSPVPLALSNETCLMFAHYLNSELGRRVLLVDGTFGDGGMSSALGHAGAPGFIDLVYSTAAPLADLVVPTSHPDVSLLPCGRTGVTYLLPIEQSRVREVFAAAASKFDYIVLQQSAIFSESRYLQFTRPADMVLMLVEEGVTPVDDLQRCLEVFRDHQVSNVRIVLTVSR